MTAEGLLKRLTCDSRLSSLHGEPLTFAADLLPSVFLSAYTLDLYL